ncbi:hypothetical protein H4S14_000810 [Agrobacterium vitis]|nr:hypothetical protein [Agrobacterium vitis]MBE1437083.1 hypothetical protein [Agrobacterium vitis]
MAANKLDVANWLAGLVSTLVTDALDADDLATRLASAVDLDAADFAAESIDIMRVIAESVNTPHGFDALREGRFDDSDTASAASILLAVGLCIAGGRAGWTSRPSARAGRAKIAAQGDAALTIVSAMGADGVDLYTWLSRLIDVAVRLVSDQAANAVPVVRVETGISLPSTTLAYRLYGDASRAEGLVDIAQSATPMIMPAIFNALES